MLSPCPRLGLLLLCLVGLAGCGAAEKRATVKGKVIVDGKDLKWDSPFPLEVVLCSENTADARIPGKSFATQAGADGSFAFVGDDGKGIPLTSYKITVRSKAYGDPAVVKKSTPPWLKTVDDQNKTPLKFDLATEGEANIVIDVVKKTVQRQP